MGFAPTWRRTHTCGELRPEHRDQEVVLNGWVHNWRNFGGVLFIVLRDRYGTTQLVFGPDNQELYADAEQLRHEFVIAVRGKVAPRPSDQVNPAMATGGIEVVVSQMAVLNKAQTPPLQIHNPEWEESEDTRLRYRYLDLRVPDMQQNILFRHTVIAEARKYLWSKDFVEIDTPILMKSTPEGARDFLVPSRMNPGRFYALPQSPQTYKQILMVAGFDRYFQIARCFRDEDLRADRQLEFAQIDMEMSFVNEEDILAACEGLMVAVFDVCLGIAVPTPFPRMTYETALHTYGSDKPDLRFGMPISDVTDVFASSGFKVFSSAVSSGGRIGAVAASGAGEFTRKTIDELTAHVGTFGAKGLVWLRMSDAGVEGPSAKHMSDEEKGALVERCSAKPGDMVFLVAAEDKVCFTSLGALRLEVGRRLKLIDGERFEFAWVTEFPLFEWSDQEQRHVSMHHPFTSPVEEDMELLQTERYHTARARAYDLVLNGNEVAGGSIRIHQPEVQKAVFSRLGIGDEEAEAKFGFLMKAFTYGAPPHGGIAFGLDRLVMVMRGLQTIRDVIAFPKTTAGLSPMDGAPDRVAEEQLRELGIAVAAKAK